MMQTASKSKFVLGAYFIERYIGRRIEIQCADGDVVRGRMGQIDQADFKGFYVHDIELNGEKLPNDMVIGESEIVSFVSLDGENEIELMPRHWHKSEFVMLSKIGFSERHIEIQCTDGTILRGLLKNVDYTKGQESIFRDFEVNGEKMPEYIVHKSKFNACIFLDEYIEIQCTDGTILRGLLKNVDYTKGQESIFRDFEVNGEKLPEIAIHKSKFRSFIFLDEDESE